LALNPHPPPAHAAEKVAPIDLLHAVPTVLAVSSVVRNNNNHPAHLVDGKLNTAWNSRTGNLNGAFIAVRLPRDVQVQGISLSVGYTHNNAEGDLFLMNPRIRRVRISRDGTSLGEFPLDPDRRNLQLIALKGPGGDYKIEVVDFLMGTKK